MPGVTSTDNNGHCAVMVLNETDKNLRVHDGQALANASRISEQVFTPVGAVASATTDTTDRLATVLHDLGFEYIRTTERTREKLRHIIDDNLDAFAVHDLDVGRVDRVFHQIHTGDSRPLRQPVRRLAYGEQREEVQKQIHNLLNAGLIRPSNSPWASPIVLVRKKDGSVRMCVDYRRLNQIAKMDAYPLPRLDETLDSFLGAQFFSSLDLAMGYHQVPVSPEDIEKTAFITHVGLFEFITMPFGLSGAPATFQRLMNSVLRGILGKFCAAYLDDIIVYSETESSHLQHLQEVFRRLRDAGLRLKTRKCVLFRPEVKYLGHVVSRAGVGPDPDKMKVVRGWEYPATVKQMQSFLGFVNFYADYVRNYSQLAGPLYALATGAPKDKIPDDLEKVAAFGNLKAAFISAPILGHPDISKPFVVQTDASKI
jgi:hypothetical protein